MDIKNIIIKLNKLIKNSEDINSEDENYYTNIFDKEEDEDPDIENLHNMFIIEKNFDKNSRSTIKDCLSVLPSYSSNFNDENFQGSCNNCKVLSKPNHHLDEIVHLNELNDELRRKIENSNNLQCLRYSDGHYCSSYIIKILHNCNCKNDKLINFVNSYEAISEYDDYIKLIKLRNYIIKYVCDVVSKAFYCYRKMTLQSEKDTFSIELNEEDLNSLFIQYENAILYYKSKYIPSESNSSTIIDNISNILLSLREKCIKGENIKDDIDMLINVLGNNDINSVNEDLDCFPGNKSSLNAKESFESNSKLLG